MKVLALIFGFFLVGDVFGDELPQAAIREVRNAFSWEVVVIKPPVYNEVAVARFADLKIAQEYVRWFNSSKDIKTENQQTLSIEPTERREVLVKPLSPKYLLKDNKVVFSYKQQEYVDGHATTRPQAETTGKDLELGIIIAKIQTYYAVKVGNEIVIVSWLSLIFLEQEGQRQLRIFREGGTLLPYPPLPQDSFDLFRDDSPSIIIPRLSEDLFQDFPSKKESTPIGG